MMYGLRTTTTDTQQSGMLPQIVHIIGRCVQCDWVFGAKQEK